MSKVIQLKNKQNDKLYFYVNSLNGDTAGFHNSIFRGEDVTKYLDDGSLWTRISSGKFTDLFIGDYFLKNDVKYRIAGFDYYLHKGNEDFSKHHIAIVPDENLTTAHMNSNDDTTGGYTRSDMVVTILPSVLSTVEEVFGSTHILEYRHLLSNAVDKTRYNRFGQNTGASSDWTWNNRKIDLMSEVQLFGTTIWSSSGFDTSSMNTQLPLFSLAPEYICIREWFWLRDVVSGSAFTYVGSSSNAGGNYGASRSLGVRPCFFIGT